jgi:hypothetical protein
MKFCKNVILVVMIACVQGVQGMQQRYVEMQTPLKEDHDHSSTSIYQQEETLKKKLASLSCWSCRTKKPFLQNKLDDVQQKIKDEEQALRSVENVSSYIRCENGQLVLGLTNKSLQKVPDLQCVGEALSSLGVLDISKNKIKHLPLGLLLASCPQLQRIDAYDNEIEDITYRLEQPYYPMPKGKFLNHLVLARNKLTTVDMGALVEACPQLKMLDLSQNPLNSLECSQKAAWNYDGSGCSPFNVACGSPIKPIIQVPAELDAQCVKALRHWYAQKTLEYRVSGAIEVGCIGVGVPLCFAQVFGSGKIVYWLANANIFGSSIVPPMLGLMVSAGATPFTPLVTGFLAALSARYCCFSPDFMEGATAEAEANVKVFSSNV